MESNISKEDGFGLVRCFNVQVIPLQWIQDLSSLDISHLPVRCKCQFGPSLQYVDLLEVSGKSLTLFCVSFKLLLAKYVLQLAL